ILVPDCRYSEPHHSPWMAHPRTIAVAKLLRLFHWMERFSRPKVLLTLVAHSQPGTQVTFSGTEGANDRPTVVRVVRTIRRRRTNEVAASKAELRATFR